jgi:YD repeat-containing protein
VRRGYDFRGLLLAVTLAADTPQQTTTTYAYDELGNQTNQVDAAGRITTFQYDALGRRIGRTLPGGGRRRVLPTICPAM